MEIVLSIIIGIVIAIVVVYLIWKQPIRISYSVNRYALVITNFCTFFFSIMCILYYPLNERELSKHSEGGQVFLLDIPNVLFFCC